MSSVLLFRLLHRQGAETEQPFIRGSLVLHKLEILYVLSTIRFIREGIIRKQLYRQQKIL